MKLYTTLIFNVILKNLTLYDINLNCSYKKTFKSSQKIKHLNIQKVNLGYYA